MAHMVRAPIFLAVTGLALALAASTPAAITPTRTASVVAQAIVSDPATLRATSAFVTIPPAGDPAATIDAPLAGFPTNGATAALLTTGNAALADDPNDSDSAGESDNGGNVRGDTDYDVTILRLDLTAPANTNCLTFQFRFASDEYPEFVGTQFNDAFIAELDGSDWSTLGSTITSPRNFAYDPAGKQISINATGGESVAPEDAAGTTYDAATQILLAATPVTPGDHSLYLSIFDQGDAIYDAAAWVDNLVFFQATAGGCQSGAVVDEASPPSMAATSIPAFSATGVIEFVVADGPRGSGPRAVHYRLNNGPELTLATVGGRATLTLPDGKHLLEFWGEDRRGNLEATHNFRTITVSHATLRISNARRKEGQRGAAAMVFLVRLSAPSPDAVTVRFATKKGTAKPKQDFVARSGLLTFAPGKVLLRLAIKIRGDRRDERNEKFSVVLTNATGTTLVDGLGIGTIVDND